MWCIDCFCVQRLNKTQHSGQQSDVSDDHVHTETNDVIDYMVQPIVHVNSDPFMDDDFSDFFNNDPVFKGKGHETFKLTRVEHKLVDVQTHDIALSIINTDVQLKGGGDASPPPTSSREIGTMDDVNKISALTRIYTSVDNFDLRVPGTRHKQITQLTRLKNLYLRRLAFYVDQDSFLSSHWEIAAMRHNSTIVDKISTLKSREKVDIITLTIHTDWLRSALEYIRDLKVSIGTTTEQDAETSVHGLDLAGVYALEDLTGSGPRLVRNIALSIFSHDNVERAEHKLDLVLQRNAHKHFSADKICQTMLRICRAANLSSDEFHGFMRHLRDAHLPSCPCGFKGSTQEAWTIHGCRYEAWVIRLGIAEVIGGYLRFSPFEWDPIISEAVGSLDSNI